MSQPAKVPMVEVLLVFSKPFDGVFRTDELAARLGISPKQVYRAMEKAEDNGWVDCGVSLRTGWITDKGRAELARLEEKL